MTFDQLQKEWSEKFRKEILDILFPEGIDLLIPDGDSRSMRERAEEVLSELEIAFYEAGKMELAEENHKSLAAYRKMGFDEALAKVREVVKALPEITFLSDILAAITKLEEEHKTI